jgi:hypothetical protein
MFPQNASLSAGRFPMEPALPAAEYSQPVGLPPGHRVILTLLACQTLRAPLAPDGSPLFACTPLAACQRYEPRKLPRTLALTPSGMLPSPLRDGVGRFDHARFRGELSVHWCSGLPPPWLRCAVTVTGHHARLCTWLLARLYQGGHLRPLSFRRLQGATPTPPDIRVPYTALRWEASPPRALIAAWDAPPVKTVSWEGHRQRRAPAQAPRPVGMPSFRPPPPGLEMATHFTGRGR